jgi:UDP-N-acetylglucosamine--N-acetylmuramyl-(pentapeptide) pyrophosphoryl-undecaprenol N-acetylglucosamine transferase
MDKNDERPLVAFTGGGTGGHIYPGLAVAQALRAKGFEGRIAWIGSKKALDRSIVEAEGIEYHPIPSGKLRRSFSFENLADVVRVGAGYIASWKILKKLRPTLLFSKGGYVSVPPCRAAAHLGIPYLTHESDASPGLATRLNSNGAAAILAAWPRTAEKFSASLRGKVKVVGNPVRHSLLLGDPRKGREILNAPEGMPVISFLGGSQGSKQINDIVAEILPRLAGKAFVFHQTGRELFDAGHFVPCPGTYLPLAYVGKEIADILAATRLVVGRSGAGTLWESLALGIPMVLIPLSGPGTRGDQVENAALAQEAGAAKSFSGDDARPEKILEAILEFLDSAASYGKARDSCLNLAKVRTEDGRLEYSSDYIAEMILERISRDQGGRL